MDNLTIFGSALFCAAPILWLKGPRRSDMWRHLIEALDWLRTRIEDAMLAAELREGRRASRRLRPTVTQINDEQKYRIQKGGA